MRILLFGAGVIGVIYGYVPAQTVEQRALVDECVEISAAAGAAARASSGAVDRACHTLVGIIFYLGANGLCFAESCAFSLPC